MAGRITSARQTLARYDQENPHTAGRVRQALGGVLVADGLVGLEPPGGQRRRPGLLGALVGIVFSVGVLLLVLWMRRSFVGSDLTEVTDDPFLVGPGPADPVGDVDRVFGWAFTAMIVIVVLMLVVATVAFVVRLASVVLGVSLLRSGRRMAEAHPATDDDPGLVEEARDALTGLLASSRRPGLETTHHERRLREERRERW